MNTKTKVLCLTLLVALIVAGTVCMIFYAKGQGPTYMLWIAIACLLLGTLLGIYMLRQ